MARGTIVLDARKKKERVPLTEPRSHAHLNLMTSISNLADEIKKHNAAVRRNSRDRVHYRKVCAVCKKGEVFAPHELRSRLLRYMVGNKVECVRVWLARWKCCSCGRSFTDHPDFRPAI